MSFSVCLPFVSWHDLTEANSKSLFVSLTRLPYGPLRPPFLFPLKGENIAEMQFISIILKNVQMYVHM